EILRYGNLTIIHDAYNANPLSFRAAMETARAMRAGRRLVFVAGTMRELGRDSAVWHEIIARELVDLEPDLLAGVGDFARALEPWRGRLGDRLLTARDPGELGPVLAGRLSGNEIIVLKASRGVALERILPWLSDRTAPSS
ncbi:MAG: glutamate ligase domain-containing protein, partial [Gemmatimonadales bacterium]